MNVASPGLSPGDSHAPVDPPLLGPSGCTITDVVVTPVAIPDPPLLNALGVHEPVALRAVIEVRTDAGAYGLGECSGDGPLLAALRDVAPALVGLDAFDINGLHRRVSEHLAARRPESLGLRMRVVAPFDIALLDLQGKLVGRPVTDLLGGRVRDTVPFAAYLFYKWAGHPGHPADGWGAATDPTGLVEQARVMVQRYGFRSLKVKGGVFSADEEADAVLALAEAFPGVPVRLDPNGAWDVETSVRISRRLEGALEYLEDPVVGHGPMAEVRRRTDIPLATNMCVVDFTDLRAALAADSVDIVLSDPHTWGGLSGAGRLSTVARDVGFRLSMHSNTHLGVSLAAMVQLAGAAPDLSYACDTHWPWKPGDVDVVQGTPLALVDGEVRVSREPGLGVSLDRDALARLHELYLDTGITTRDDTGYMRRFVPDYEPTRPAGS